MLRGAGAALLGGRAFVRGVAAQPARGHAENYAVLPSRASAAATRVPGSVTIVETLGYRHAGDGGGARHKRVDVAPKHALWFRSADGAYWEWDDRTLDIRMAGAIADGVWNRDGDWKIGGGTDNRRAIQDCIDAHAFFNLSDHVYFPAGQFRIAGPLHCYTGTYFPAPSVKLLGAGFSWRGSQMSRHEGYPGAAGGSFILCDFSDAFAVGISSSGLTCSGLAFVGRNYAWIRANQLGVAPKIDDTVAGNWVDPGLAPNAASGTAPYACFAIDPYMGPHDHGRYPDYSPPVWAPGPVVAASTDIEIAECYIAGFAVGIVDQPGGFDGNGDFLKTRRCYFECCQYALSIGNSQSRNVLRDSNTYYYCFCLETTNVHGARVGKMAGLSVNCSADRCIQIFQFGSTYYSGPIVYQSFYAEGLWRLGDVESNTVAETSVTFIGLQCFMNGETPLTRGTPATWLGSGGTFTPGHPVKIGFIDCALAQYPSVISIGFDSECVHADGLDLRSNTQSVPGGDYAGVGLRAAPYQRFASNATADGLVLHDGQSRTGRMRLKFLQYDVDTGRPTKDNTRVVFAGPAQSSDRHHPACSYAQRLTAAAEGDADPGIWLPPTAHSLDKADLLEATLHDKSLTFTLPPARRGAAAVAYNGPLPGDVILDQATGSVFFVRLQDSQNGAVVATLQNNYRSVDSGRTFQTIVPIDLRSGTLIVINSRLFTPAHALEGDLTAASATVVHAGEASGASEFMTADLAVGDWFYVDPARDLPVDRDGSAIAAVAAGSFAFAGKAIRGGYRRFGVFIRPGSGDG
jgi:hypothetical protein